MITRGNILISQLIFLPGLLLLISINLTGSAWQWVGFLAVQFQNTTSDLTKWAEQDSGGEEVFVKIFLLNRWLSGDLNNQIISPALPVSQCSLKTLN